MHHTLKLTITAVGEPDSIFLTPCEPVTLHQSEVETSDLPQPRAAEAPAPGRPSAGTPDAEAADGPDADVLDDPDFYVLEDSPADSQ